MKDEIRQSSGQWLASQTNNPFTIYDQGTSIFGWTPQDVRLGYWKFDTTNLTSESGLHSTTSNEVGWVPDWSGHAVSINNESSHLAYPVSAGGVNYFDPANGTIRFWFQPNWSNASPSAPPAPFGGLFFCAAGTDVGLSLGVVPDGSDTYVMQFNSQSNQFNRSWTFKTGGLNGAPITFKSGWWYQFVLTYSPTNMALYTNGTLLATANWPSSDAGNPIYEEGLGNLYYPPVSGLDSFCFGSELDQPCAVLGQLDELETFNYALTPQQVAAGFPTFAGSTTNVMLDTYYAGRSDMLQTYVDGVPPSPNAAPCRLGYWRFDSSLLYAEQGQMPLSVSNVGLTPSWSGTALVINSASDSQVTYPDVGSNGWANINCRQGSLRFWFKPNGTRSANAPFVYMGTNTGSDQWGLWLNSAGTSISFITASNGVVENNLTEPCNLTNTSHWAQIVLTYGSTNSILYINGSPVGTGMAVTNWPSLSNRNLGMVIGNSTAYNASINGQFEEMETFNYQLSASQILSNFQIVTNVDSDLDGIPDLLEDIHLSTNRPFLGAPVVITGAIVAAQFDMGSNTVGYYHNGATNPPSSYRPTGMYINTCDDLGGGYCLDQTQAGDWTKYSIDVRVPQTYMVEVRAEAIGANTGGMFQCDFTNGVGVITNSAGISNSTGPLSITTTNWTNYSKVVYLTTNMNVMTLHCLSNATNGSNVVGRFNYISVYPWWTPPTNGPGSNYVNPLDLMTNSNFYSASNNAYWIQYEVSELPTNGGIVTIPAGTWYVAQASPNEASAAWQNAAVSIMTNNIEITGEGEDYTTLIAYNRATTIFSVGATSNYGFAQVAQCSNFTLCNMTLEGQPHLAITNIATTTNISGTNVFYDTNELAYGYPDDQNTNINGGPYIGAATTYWSPSRAQSTYNILITNCQFLYGWNPIQIWDNTVTNVLVRSNVFNMWGGSNINFGNVAIFTQGGFNIVVTENLYNGNTNLTNATFAEVSNNAYYNTWISAVGLVWVQYCGNVFVARNTIQNYLFEGVQLNAGPNAVVGNTYSNLDSNGSACALALSGSDPGVTGLIEDHSTCFVGNSVYGGRSGVQPRGTNAYGYSFNCSGNTFTLYPPFDTANAPDEVAAAVTIQNCVTANICGNTLLAGGLGFSFSEANSNALLLNNQFGGATFGGIGYSSALGGSLNSAQIYGNTFSEGVSFHVQLTYSNSFGWFLDRNTYWNSDSNSVPPFLDPLSSSVHISN